MDVEEIKRQAKEKAEENIFELFGICMIELAYKLAFPFNFFFFCLEPGINLYMVKYVNNKKAYIDDIVKYIEKMWEFFSAGFYRRIITFFSYLLFIVPGIYAHYRYALVPLILTDPKLKSARGMECLRVSSDMMHGHIFECFLLDISFIYLHLLGILSLGILEVYIIPYQSLAKYKILYEIKKKYMGEEPSYMLESDATYTPVAIIKAKKVNVLPKSVDKDGNFKAKYCMKCGKQLPEGAITCLYCGYVYKLPKVTKKRL